MDRLGAFEDWETPLYTKLEHAIMINCLYDLTN